MTTSQNLLKGLDYLEADDLDSMRDLLRSIPLPTTLLGDPRWDPQRGKYVAWILTEAKIKKLKKVVAK